MGGHGENSIAPPSAGDNKSPSFGLIFYYSMFFPLPVKIKIIMPKCLPSGGHIKLCNH